MRRVKGIVAAALALTLVITPVTGYAENIEKDIPAYEEGITELPEEGEELPPETEEIPGEEVPPETEGGEEVPPETEEKPPVIEKKATPKLMVQVHVQDYGWMDWKEAGEFIGTTGKSKRLEAFRVKIEYEDGIEEAQKYTGSVIYRAHIQDHGWQSWKKDGELAGTNGERKRIEAISIKFSGELAEVFDVYYKIHVSDIGWLDWTKNGSYAGTEALSKRTEAMEIEFVKKNEESEIDVSGRSYIKGIKNADILASAHIQNVGDTKESSIVNTIGSVGKSQRLEALRFRIAEEDKNRLKGNIQYRTHVQNIGWQDWKENNELAGTQGQSKRIEAIQLQLTDELAKYYDIYYRTHVQNYGWLGWAKNGQIAGTTKFGYRMEAVQVRLVLKGNPAPGSNSNYYKEAKTGWYYEGGYKFYYINAKKILDLDNILPKQSSYEIKVNRKMNTVTVYAKDGDNGYIIPVKRFACSVGLPATPTPKGTFYTSQQLRWHMLMGPSYGQYCTRITRDILFHSVAGRNMTSYNLNARDYNKLGSAASHGCVRLNVRDAKWIYDNCALKTKVTIYDSSDPGPLGKPATIKIPAGQTWDPTDPNVIR